MSIRCSEFRAYLKVPSLEDADLLAENANDPEIARNVAKKDEFPNPYTKTDAVRFIEFVHFASTNGIEFHFGIYSMATDKIMGMIALMNSKDQMPKSMEVGYWLGKPYWGQGYAKEALLLMLHFGFEELKLSRITAKASESNKRSIRVLESAKFSRDKKAESVQEDGKGRGAAFVLTNSGYEALKLSDERIGRIYTTEKEPEPKA